MTDGVSGWFPTSPCTPTCLPTPAPDDGWVRLRRRVRTVARLSALAVVLLAGVPVAALAPLLGPARLGRAQALWCGRLLAAAGVRVVVTGPRPAPGSLVVANHVSWLDVLALNRVAPVRMLAKTEVRDWPLIGPMAARAGTVFLDRDRLRALPDAVAAVAGALRTDSTVGVFAEGTTRCGRDLGRFRPAAFQAAVDAGAPVVPVALAYAAADGTPDASAAFVGDDDLMSSLIRVAAAPRTVLTVRVLPSWTPVADAPRTEPERRRCARRAAAAVTAALPTPDLDARPLPAVHAPAPPAVPAAAASPVRRSEVTRAA
ncbi:lysophospholipid acyltransferase family protein [Actinomycetospora sp. OC33-EN08]|uniref:1-acyl-sn-glycerol-3-phosphate acyltransferase n=1 Tax=Actinomycetospora aurantiaca TaxID=3129233 RepID=A0ABU8MI98_9PSEU